MIIKLSWWRLRKEDKKISYSLHTIHFYVQKCEIKVTVDYVNTHILLAKRKKKPLFAVAVRISLFSIEIFKLGVYVKQPEAMFYFLFLFFLDDLSRLMNASKMTIKINVP